MLPICTIEEMQNIDRKSVAGNLDLGFALMSEAAQGLANLVTKLASETYINDIVIFPSLTIVCGKGNNGGDGFKLAYLLRERKFNLKIFSLASESDLQGEALMAYKEIKKYQEQNKLDLISYIKTDEDLAKLETSLIEDLRHEISRSHHFLVESLLGTGTSGNPHGLYAKTISIINKFRENSPNLSVVATDGPAGIDCNSGIVHESAIRADYSVVMGFAKLGSLFYPAKNNYGNLLIHSLNYPKHIVEAEHQSKIYLPELKDLQGFLAPRKQDGSKYDHGLATLISGSPGMTGAPTLAARAALRSGLGFLHLFTDAESAGIIAQNVVEAVIHDISSLKQGEMQAKFLASKVNAVCIGPGLGNRHNDLIYEIVKNSQITIILDADGINAFVGKLDLLKNRNCDLLLTPHQGEYMRLFPEDDLNSMSPLETIQCLRKRAQELRATILLKGSPTLIADPSGKIYLNTSGNSALATAGTGDVLSGIITGLTAQLAHRKINQELSIVTQAAILGAYLHGKAGELASDKLTEYSVIASDLINYIPSVIKEILRFAQDDEIFCN